MIKLIKDAAMIALTIVKFILWQVVLVVAVLAVCVIALFSEKHRN
jgi:uncharacterized membrane protein